MKVIKVLSKGPYPYFAWSGPLDENHVWKDPLKYQRGDQIKCFLLFIFFPDWISQRKELDSRRLISNRLQIRAANKWRGTRQTVGDRRKVKTMRQDTWETTAGEFTRRVQEDRWGDEQSGDDWFATAAVGRWDMTGVWQETDRRRPEPRGEEDGAAVAMTAPPSVRFPWWQLTEHVYKLTAYVFISTVSASDDNDAHDCCTLFKQ